MTDLAAAITTERLELRPLSLADAAEMHAVLAAPALYEFTGGSPPSLEELENRYFLQTTGDPIGAEVWLNWVVRIIDGPAIGFVQATVAEDATELAWLIGVEAQGNGYATEATAAMRAHLERCDVTSFRATIHPDHVASKHVAHSIGLMPTDEYSDGEVVWVAASA